MPGTQWEHVFGVSAGAGLPGSRLLGQDVSFAQCIGLCEAVPTCTAVDYVRKHHAELQPVAGGRSARVCSPVLPAKRGCYEVDGVNWKPCLPTQTENIVARKQVGSPVPPHAKNVLLVVFDDLRVVDEPFRGTANRVASEFASGATTFLAAHAQAALCAPSRVSFLSGRRPDVTRVFWTDSHLRQWPRAQGWVTLPQHFKRRGYYVAAAGKMYHHLPDPLSLDPASWSEPECVADFPYYGQGHCPEKVEYTLQVFNTSAACPVDHGRHPDFVFTDHEVLAKARQFLATATPAALDGTRPFFIGAGFFKPHKPFVFPQELLHRMPALADVRLPANAGPAQRMGAMANIAELCALKSGPSRHFCERDTIRTYHAAASFTDSLLGSLLHDLGQRQLEQTTLVVVMSDHGFALGEHGAWAKWTNWEVATRAVLMIRTPWLPSSMGQRISTPVELVDVYPTIADLAGVPLLHDEAGYEELGGKSLGAAIRSPSNDTSAAAFSQMARCWPAGAARNASTFFRMAQCDGVAPADYAYMGYSIRTSTHRYTEWVPTRWDAQTSRHIPLWSESVGRELYSHVGDDGSPGWSTAYENVNIAAYGPPELLASKRRLHAHFDAAQRSALRTTGEHPDLERSLDRQGKDLHPPA